MVCSLLNTNYTFTDVYFPFFEIVYSFEFCFIFLFYLLTPICLYMLWNAHPFHRNPRLSLCNLVIKGLIGTTARLIIIYSQYADIGPYEERPSLIIASLLRYSMFETFVGVIFFFSFERLIATFAWSWYEKASSGTLIVFALLESGALMWSWCWSFALVFEIINRKQFLCSFALSATVGGSVGLFVSAVNSRATRKLRAGTNSEYSVARTFQIRENIVIIKALATIGARIMLLNIIVFVLTLCHLLLTGLKERMIVRALTDLIISVYPVFIITYLPLSDQIFEKSLKRMSYGSTIFRIFSLLHWKRSKQNMQEAVVMNETEQYFRMLAESFNGPAG